MDAHTARVAEISRQVKEFYEQKVPFRIYHGSTNSTRPTVRTRSTAVDVSGLKNVLSVDTASQTAIVEPNVPMDALVAATLPHGLLPPVVPEFPGITVGGGFAGTAGESSSFKHGFLDSTVCKIELVLANGEVMIADKFVNEDLFYGTAGTLGTLGVLTLFHVRLVDASSFVEVAYHRVNSFSHACEKITEVVSLELDYDFVDGIMYAPNRGAIITGRFASTLPTGTSSQRFTRRGDPWFYMHAERQLAKSTADQPIVDYVPVVDYLFRYDRGGFWVGKFAFDYFHLPFCAFLRYALDQFLKTRSMYHALHTSGLTDKYIVQDVAIPLTAAATFLKGVDEDFSIYPLWLCPLKFGRMGLRHRNLKPETHPMLLNVGIWAPGPEDVNEREAMNRRLEEAVAGMGGTKWLYAQTYYTEEEFWRIYDHENYVQLREKYGATGLPDVYAKVKKLAPAAEPTSAARRAGKKVKGFWVFPGLYGLFRSRIEKDYIMSG
jgi:Delta24-sterol reductase